MPLIADLVNADALEAMALAVVRAQSSKSVSSRDLAAARALADPLWFFTDILGCSTVWPKMVEMLERVRDNNRVSICGCNSSSKDYTMGRVLLWWLFAHHPSKVIVTGPTQRQVQDVVWRETRDAFYASKLSLPGHILPVEPRLEVSNQHFALGFSTDKPYRLTGFHSPHLLVIITEAYAIAQRHIDAVKMLNPEKLILTGNPLTVGGEFFDSHHGRGGYQTVNISAFDTPNLQGQGVVIPGMITEADVAIKQADWGEADARYIATVLGEFPENLGGGIVPAKAVNEAVDRDIEPGKPVVVACDVAGRGTDKTVVFRREGGFARVVYRENYTDDLTVLADWLDNYLKTNRAERIIVDSVGIGFGLAGNLRRLGIRNVDEFVGGARAREGNRFADCNAEVWWRMREAFLAGELDMENDPDLMRQLTSRQYIIQGDKRVRLQSKDGLSHSPDEADALAMTFVVQYSPGSPDHDPVVAKKPTNAVLAMQRNRSVLVVGKGR